jgi:hypothetical protein
LTVKTRNGDCDTAVLSRFSFPFLALPAAMPVSNYDGFRFATARSAFSALFTSLAPPFSRPQSGHRRFRRPSSQKQIPSTQSKVTKLIELIGADKHPGQPLDKKPVDRDQRYSNKERNWAFAVRKREALNRNNSPDFRETISELAVASGFFGVWDSVLWMTWICEHVLWKLRNLPERPGTVSMQTMRLSHVQMDSARP